MDCMTTAEGYTVCEQGHAHWGRNGAAGLLLTVASSDGPLFLLQHRSPEVHEGDCWGVPGGALDWDETPQEGALREAQEEMGEFPAPTGRGRVYALDHGGWAYSTVVLEVPHTFAVYATNWETGPEGYRWVTLEELETLKLHSGFALFVREVLLPQYAAVA